MNTIPIAIFGTIFTLVGAYSLFSFIRIFKNGFKTSGVLVRQELVESYRNRRYISYVQIKIDDQLLELPLQIQTPKNFYKEGKEIEVRYYKGKVYSSMKFTIFLTSLIILIGLLALLISIPTII